LVPAALLEEAREERGVEKRVGARDLRELELALLEPRRVRDPLIGELDVRIEAPGDARVVLVVLQHVARDLERVIVQVAQAETERADRALLVDGALDVVEVRGGVADLLAALILVTEALAVRAVHQHAEAPGVAVAEVPAVAERDLRAHVRVERLALDADPRIEAVEQPLVNRARLRDRRKAGCAQRREDVCDADVAPILRGRLADRLRQRRRAAGVRQTVAVADRVETEIDLEVGDRAVRHALRPDRSEERRGGTERCRRWTAP